MIELEGKRTELSGRHPGPTTNNRMEIQGAIEGLKFLPPHCRILIITDSQYLRNAGATWIKLWKKRSWMTREQTPVKNDDLWRQLDELMALHQVKWKWMRSHQNQGNENDRCDALASKCRDNSCP